MFLKELNRLSGKIDVKTIIKLHYNDHVYNKVDKKIIDFIKNSENLIYFKNLNLDNILGIIYKNNQTINSTLKNIFNIAFENTDFLLDSICNSRFELKDASIKGIYNNREYVEKFKNLF